MPPSPQTKQQTNRLIHLWHFSLNLTRISEVVSSLVISEAKQLCLSTPANVQETCQSALWSVLLYVMRQCSSLLKKFYFCLLPAVDRQRSPACEDKFFQWLWPQQRNRWIISGDFHIWYRWIVNKHKFCICGFTLEGRTQIWKWEKLKSQNYY
jgi:hypothetical protein